VDIDSAEYGKNSFHGVPAETPKARARWQVFGGDGIYAVIQNMRQHEPHGQVFKGGLLGWGRFPSLFAWWSGRFRHFYF